MAADPKILINWAPLDYRTLNTSRFSANENDLEFLTCDHLIEDARQAITCRIITERIGRAVVAGRT
jgi:hypothetical protein